MSPLSFERQSVTEQWVTNTAFSRNIWMKLNNYGRKPFKFSLVYLPCWKEKLNNSSQIAGENPDSYV